MRPFTSVITLDEAKHRLERAVRPIERTELVGLIECSGRVAATTVTSPIDVPSFDRSAMDGYAVIAADTAGVSEACPRPLQLIDRIYTGRMSPTTVVSGTCAEIATGAPLPAGADAVVIVEDTSKGADDQTIQVRTAVTSGQHVSPKGTDIAAGAVVISVAELLMASRAGALAAIGVTEVAVYEKPLVAILSTGNEIIEPGHPLAPGQIYDINRFTLSAVVADNGGVPVPLPPVPDTVDALSATLEMCQ